MYFPIQAAPGEFLSVWRLSDNLWVYDARTDSVVRRGRFDEGKLWTVLADLIDAGTITPLDFAEHARFRATAQPREGSSRSFLRVVRRA